MMRRWRGSNEDEEHTNRDKHMNVDREVKLMMLMVDLDMP